MSKTKHNKSPQIKTERVTGPYGDFIVSTIRTYAGGAHEVVDSFIGRFSSKDYLSETPWHFETMVFKAAHATGTARFQSAFYFTPYLSEKAAKQGHKLTVAMVMAGFIPIKEVRDSAYLRDNYWKKLSDGLDLANGELRMGFLIRPYEERQREKEFRKKSASLFKELGLSKSPGCKWLPLAKKVRAA